MTNEEAIGILKFIKDINGVDPEMIDDEDVMALDIAIHALKEMNLIKFNVHALNELLRGEDNGS